MDYDDDSQPEMLDGETRKNKKRSSRKRTETNKNTKSKQFEAPETHHRGHQSHSNKPAPMASYGAFEYLTPQEILESNPELANYILALQNRVKNVKNKIISQRTKFIDLITAVAKYFDPKNISSSMLTQYLENTLPPLEHTDIEFEPLNTVVMKPHGQQMLVDTHQATGQSGKLDDAQNAHGGKKARPKATAKPSGGKEATPRSEKGHANGSKQEPLTPVETKPKGKKTKEPKEPKETPPPPPPVEEKKEKKPRKQKKKNDDIDEPIVNLNKVSAGAPTNNKITLHIPRDYQQQVQPATPQQLYDTTPTPQQQAPPQVQINAALLNMNGPQNVPRQSIKMNMPAEMLQYPQQQVQQAYQQQVPLQHQFQHQQAQQQAQQQAALLKQLMSQEMAAQTPQGQMQMDLSNPAIFNQLAAAQQLFLQEQSKNAFLANPMLAQQAAAAAAAGQRTSTMMDYFAPFLHTLNPQPDLLHQFAYFQPPLNGDVQQPDKP